MLLPDLDDGNNLFSEVYAIKRTFIRVKNAAQWQHDLEVSKYRTLGVVDTVKAISKIVNTAHLFRNYNQNITPLQEAHLECIVATVRPTSWLEELDEMPPVLLLELVPELLRVLVDPASSCRVT